MTREEAITVLKAFMENPLFSEVHKAAFNIAIHDIKAYHDWNINNLILVNKDNYEPIEQEPTTKNEAKYCDRNICLKNEYNNVGCEDCEVTKSQESTTKNDLGVDCISREQALVAIRNLYPGMPRVDFNGSLRKWVDKYKPYIECDDAIEQLPSVTPQEPRWIPVSERLPERAEEGASNWHTDTVMVCMYGNAQYDRYDDFGYEILTGIFEELEDEKTKTKDLCFVPDRFTLFIPDEWDFFVLDKNYETHLPKNECMYLVDDYSDKSEFHDKYFKVLAWMPLPAPYEPQESEG